MQGIHPFQKRQNYTKYSGCARYNLLILPENGLADNPFKLICHGLENADKYFF